MDKFTTKDIRAALLRAQIEDLLSLKQMTTYTGECGDLRECISVRYSDVVDLIDKKRRELSELQQ